MAAFQVVVFLIAVWVSGQAEEMGIPNY